MGDPSTVQQISVAELAEAQETLLIPLWARAVETRHPAPILVDRKAAEIVDALEYDFDKFVRARVSEVGFCARAVLFDKLLGTHLEQHPDSAFVEFGPGLDTRFERLDNGSLRWFDVDLPEAMEVRRRFFTETERRKLIAASALDSDWIEAVKQSNPQSVLFLAEGVFYFFTTEQIIALFSNLADHFPGASIVFDSESPLYVWYSNLRHPLKDSKISCSIRSIKQIEKWDPRFKVEQSLGFGDAPYYDPLMKRFPLINRVARKVFPPVRNMFRITKVRLG